MNPLATWLETAFSAEGFAPHGTCLAWQPGVLWLHVVSDALIGLAYYSIPAALFVLLWKRRDLGFGWVAALFAAFILACGTTHLLGVWTLWTPDYVVEGVVKAATAAISVATAIVLWPLLPRALATPTPEQMAVVNTALQREVVEKERVAEQLRDSEARYATVFDNVADALMTFSISDDGLFLAEMVNPVAARALGLDRTHVNGQRLEDLVRPVAARDLHTRFTACCQDGAPCEFEQVIHLTGGLVLWQVVVMPLTGPDGRIHKLLVTARDVTERRRLEEEVLQASKLATIGTLSASIAHEMSQPLHAISMWSDIARKMIDRIDAPRPEQLDKAIAVISDQALRMRAIIDHMRSYSRRDDGAAEPFAVTAAAERAITLVEQEYKLRDVALALEAEAGPLSVVGRTVQLEQVLINLLGNALDAVSARTEATAGAAARRVTVTTRRAGDHAEILVEDTGGGLDEDAAERLFEAFFTTKAEGSGTGLGLAICERIVTSMGGTIAATNVHAGSAEAGARFTVSLPLAPETAPQQT